MDSITKDTVVTLGVNTLYDWQVKAIHTLLAGNDVLVSAGTGSGKTNAFHGAIQFFEKNEVMIIISPINALMHDHVSLHNYEFLFYYLLS